MPNFSDYIFNSALNLGLPGIYVGIVNNSTSTPYKAGPTTAQGLYTFTAVPPGAYTVYTSPTGSGNPPGGDWVATGDTMYVVIDPAAGANGFEVTKGVTFGTIGGANGVFDNSTILKIKANPTYTTVTNPGFLVSDDLAGVITGGQAFINLFSCNSDTMDTTAAQGGGADFVHIGQTVSATAKGGRTALVANLNQLGATTPGAQFYVAFGATVSANSSAGGAAGAGNSRGQLNASNPVASLRTGGGLYWTAVVGEEVDIEAQSGTGVVYKEGFKVTQLSTDSAAGSVADYAIGLVNQQAGTAPGWTVGFTVGSPDGWWPIKSTGTIFGTYVGAGGGPAMNAGIGIDFSAVAFSTAFLKSTGFQVDGSGSIKIANTQSLDVLTAGALVLGPSVATVITLGAATTNFNNAAYSVALGGGAAPTLGTIGGSGPATAAQNSWLKVQIQGTTTFIPVWR